MNKQIHYVARGFLVTVLLLGVAVYIQSVLKTSASPAAVVTTMAPMPEKVLIVINEKGKALFQDKCASCHRIWGTGIPLLEHVEDKVERPVLYEWIRNSDNVLQSGNKYFNSLVTKFGGVRMTNFPELTNADIDAILEYVRQEYLILNGKATPVL